MMASPPSLPKRLRSRLLALDGEDLVAYQLMTIGSHHSQTIGTQIEIDTVHHRAQLVLSCSEDGAVDILSEHQIGNGNRVGIFADRLSHGELVGILDGQ